VTNVSGNGFWLLLDGEELFVSFEHFPWFRDASIGQVLDVVRPAADHLYWPGLDVDLAVKSLTNPERYPLVSRVRTSDARTRPGSRPGAVAQERKARTTRSRR
jgi:hypothetical protein